MASSATSPYLSHIERTAASPRDPSLHTVTLSRIDPVNPQIRLMRFDIHNKDGMTFAPGQWLDTFTPTPKPGGFTVTSPPSSALPLSNPAAHPAPSGRDQRLQALPYLELAIQRSPGNPPAAWLWQSASAILGKQLDVRVGGSFVYPPEHRKQGAVRDLVLVAGGVGVNPFMSILGSLAHNGAWPARTTLLYATRVPEEGVKGVLFYERVRGMEGVDMRIYVGKGGEGGKGVVGRRMSVQDVREVVCDENGRAREGTVCYVCGPKGMTDEFVEGVRGFEGMRGVDVMCERWW